MFQCTYLLASIQIFSFSWNYEKRNMRRGREEQRKVKYYWLKETETHLFFSLQLYLQCWYLWSNLSLQCSGPVFMVES
uniref:Ovule protein n=1 Tax=Parascaris univalens TaxID=6257 RepID=A0A915A1I2_PARUN